MVILPLCYIYSNSGHFCSSMDMPDTNYNLRTPVMLKAKFGLNQFSTFRGEDFLKSLQTDGRQTKSDDKSLHGPLGQVS